MPTTTIAKRMYFSKPPRTTGSTTKRRKMASIASRESQASVADKSRASTKEAANKAINIGGLPGLNTILRHLIIAHTSGRPNENPRYVSKAQASPSTTLCLGSVRDLCFCVKIDRKSTRLNSSHGYISYAVFCLKKKTH